MTAMPIARASKAQPPSAALPEPPQNQILTSRYARMSGYGQPQNLSTTLDVQRIQNALRMAERGDVWMLFTIYRDVIIGYTHLQAEWNKRKMVITGQPETLIPHDPNNEDDKIACEVIREMIDNCRNWFDGLNHLLDATLYPLSIAEKIYEPVSMSDGAIKYKHPVRYRLKEIAPVDYTLLCFKIPYMPSFSMANSDSPQAFNADDWESWLRLYKTNPSGNVIWSTAEVYRPDPVHHIVHRGNMLSPTIAPNFGGHMRSILFWWLLATQDRDWWAQFMAKFGMPIMIGKADAQQRDTVEFLQQAFSMATQLGGLVIDKRAEVELAQVNSTDGSNAHKLFSDFCNSEVSKIVVGQSMSAKPEKTGMGSGAANQSEEIREDIRQQDTMRLSDTLCRQLFRQYLDINGYKGNVPKTYWGGMRPGAGQAMADTLNKLGAGGYELDDAGLINMSQRYGFGIQRREIPTENKLADHAKPNGGKLVKY